MLLAVALLIGCSGEGEELEAPMLGDCTDCNSNPAAGGGISGSSDASIGDDAAGLDGSLDAIDLVDIGVPE
jgi:hypothetical protein